MFPTYPLISSSEDKQTYDLILKFIKKEAKTPPTAVMADGSKAISSSCKEHFPQAKRLMCWYHAVKNMKDKLGGVKSEDPTMAKNILSDITTLQSGAPDDESFYVIFGLLKKKWIEDKIYYMESLRQRVCDFFTYMEDVWMSDDLKNWFEAVNPMMCSTNNSLEATNNILKREYTQCKRRSIPHLFENVKDFVGDWSLNMKQEFDRMQLVPPTVKIKAEYLLKKMEPFILFRDAKRVDRASVTVRGNVLTGKLIEVGMCPKQNYNFTTKAQYNTDCKNVIKRRRYMTYSDFDQFRKDLSEMAVMEVIKLDDGVGKKEFFCNCLSVTGESGSKGEMCIHVCARYFNVL